MTNKIIIDAWNVCWKIPAIVTLIPDELEKARKQFNLLIKKYFINKNVIYKIFYDGQPGIYPQGQKPDQQIYFSRNPEKADELILNFLKKQSRKKDWTVITSDRQLSERAKNLGANILKAEIFIAKLAKSNGHTHITSSKENPKIRKDDISYWLDKFDSNN